MVDRSKCDVTVISEWFGLCMSARENYTYQIFHSHFQYYILLYKWHVNSRFRCRYHTICFINSRPYLFWHLCLPNYRNVHFGGVRFGSWLGYLLYWLIFYVVFYSLSKNTGRIRLKILLPPVWKSFHVLRIHNCLFTSFDVALYL